MLISKSLPTLQQALYVSADIHSLDLVHEDLGRTPGDPGCIRVHPIDEQGPASTDVVDGVVHDGLDARAFGNDVKAVYLSA